MVPETVGLPMDARSGQAQLQITLKSVAPEAFAAKARQPKPQSPWKESAAAPPERATDEGFLVVVDPGHGGIDPGAIREGVHEADLMLEVARNLREVLRRDGIGVVLTRDADTFVSLTGRIAIAQQAGADLFLSLHADTVTEGNAQGATVYMLSETASDAASAQLAAQMDRADILAGLDLAATEDRVAVTLMQLARQETAPRTDRFADALVRNIKASGAPLYRKPKRQAAFSVLRSPDIPSVLLEMGFMSDDRDLRNLRDPIWRAMMIEAIADAILEWRGDDLALKPMVRQ
jgi:N-acetylmuramoyl-L-alanine amidase